VLVVFSSHKKAKFILEIIFNLWWFIFIFHTSLLSVSWLLFNSDAEAYSIIESIANTTLNESLEFFNCILVFYSICWLDFKRLILYFFILFKYFNTREFHDQKVHRLGRYAIGLLFLLCTASYAIKPSIALHIHCHFGMDTMAKFKISNSVFYSMIRYIKNGH
jgi:heptose-I-phosphate ethanolaminephosphotransferase